MVQARRGSYLDERVSPCVGPCSAALVGCGLLGRWWTLLLPLAQPRHPLASSAYASSLQVHSRGLFLFNGPINAMNRRE